MHRLFRFPRTPFGLTFGVLLFPVLLRAQSPEHASRWRGFERVDFERNGAKAFLVKPRRALPGLPWVWRASFPEWHPEIDSLLLERGFHVAYVDAPDLFGHARALAIWDDFYDFLTHEKGFAPKPALEAVSRGGLYAYAWAKRHPERVSCVYAEAPVCDFTSWPGGKGKGVGSSGDWEKLLNVFGFSDAQALAYADQPKDNLAALAGFKVPILHVVGLNDRLVPTDENTQVLVNNYVRLGGPATIFPATRGTQTLQGHHFPIENPGEIADFIFRNSVPVVRPLDRAAFRQPNGWLDNAAYRIRVEKKATVAFLGGSITAGVGWRDRVSRYLQETFPETEFTFRNAGIPSLGSLPHAFRLERDVLSGGRVDLLFVEAAVNDHANGTPEQTQRRALEGIIRHAYAHNPTLNVVLMAFVDEFKLADYAAGRVPPEVAVHQQIAGAYGLPFLNLADEIRQRIRAGELSWEYDFRNLHPSPMGHALYAASLNELLRLALTRPLPGGPTAAKLPAPLDAHHYAGGTYVSPSAARKAAGFRLDSAWVPRDSVGTRPGFVRVPMLVAEAAGASFELMFDGRAVGIAVVSGPDAGTLAYRIDNGPEQTIDLFTPWSSSLHLPWYLLLGDELKPGQHTLRVRVLPHRHVGSTGTACRIVQFLVNR